jgi:hypothetical protein
MPVPPGGVIVDDLDVPPGIPGGAGAGVFTVEGRISGGGARKTRIFVLDDIDIAGTWAWSSAPLWADNILLTATFDPATGRVVLVGTGLEPFTLVRVERSTNLVQWVTVRGASSVAVVGGSVTLYDYEFADGVINYYRLTTLAPFGQTSDIASVTPALDRIWLNSISRPFLNRSFMIVGFTDPMRPARSSEFDVVGRSYPVAVNDIRTSRRWSIEVYTTTAADAQTLDYILASGDVIYLNTPAGCDVPGGYVAIKDYAQRHPAGRVRGESRITSLPLVEVAQPGPDVGGDSATWASVLAAYATWADVLAAFPTWADLLELVGDPSEVIVP